MRNMYRLDLKTKFLIHSRLQPATTLLTSRTITTTPITIRTATTIQIPTITPIPTATRTAIAIRIATATAVANGGQGGQGGQGGNGYGGTGYGGNATGGNATGGNANATGGNANATGGNSNANGGSATANGNGGSAVNGGNNTRITTSIVNAPDLTSGISGCMTVGSTSVGVSVGGFGGAIGSTRSKFNRECADNANAQALLRTNDPSLQALGIGIMAQQSENVASAVTTTVGGVNEATERCGRVTNPLQAFGAACEPRREQPAPVAAAPAAQPAPEVNVTVNLQQPAASSAPRAAAPAARRAAPARRQPAAAPSGRPAASASGGSSAAAISCPAGQTPVAICRPARPAATATTPRR